MDENIVNNLFIYYLFIEMYRKFNMDTLAMFNLVPRKGERGKCSRENCKK